jgi:hypothetical protein
MSKTTKGDRQLCFVFMGIGSYVVRSDVNLMVTALFKHLPSSEVGEFRKT